MLARKPRGSTPKPPHSQPAKGRPPNAAPTQVPAVNAAQDWLPIADLRDGCLIRPDGGVVGGIAVAPLSLQLKSEPEKRAIIGAVHAAVNGLTVPFQIVSLYRPVDLDQYLASLDAMLANADQARKQVLRDYLAWVHGLVRSGEAVERRYYVLVTRRGPDALQEHRTSLPALASDLQRARGMQCRVMSDADWRELLFLAFHAGQASVEGVPDGLRLPPIYSGGVVNA